ncbi:MAG: RagB/SusD family nutrient uptake outer membrane protein, partial [Duncaniella sp.]|nr:RagB/SusD family nutrient uptake outer membrane protein [Duncaniella sp.]
GLRYEGSSPYLTFTVNGTDVDLVNMSYSLWAVIGHSNNVYENLAKSPAPEEVRRYCQGECLTWKALAYFYLVRTFGDVPIIHSNSAELENGTYNTKFKVRRADVYEYIIMTLEKAIELLPEKASQAGRIDRYCAKGLLAKVYLTKAGLSGTRNADDLSKAASYAKDVIDNSGRQLMPEYSDIFRLQNNVSDESLIAWRWKAGRDPWTQQNTLQSDLAPVGFDEFGDCWGGYGGPSVNLQDAFGIDVLEDPSQRRDLDKRRKATMMLPGDKYEYFWTDKGGFDPLNFCYDEEYGKGGPGEWQSGTGAWNVKHLYGNTYDHVSALGVSPDNMANELATHILRLADVYLIYAEAKMGTANSTSDADALAAFNAVRGRALTSYEPMTTITYDDIWKERLLELAGEGDRWYDYVRRSYWDMNYCINELTTQRRNTYWNLNNLYKAWYNSDRKSWQVEAGDEAPKYDTDTPAPNVTASSFTLPFPTADVVFNPNLLKDPVECDVRSEYSY